MLKKFGPIWHTEWRLAWEGGGPTKEDRHRMGYRELGLWSRAQESARALPVGCQAAGTVQGAVEILQAGRASQGASEPGGQLASGWVMGLQLVPISGTTSKVPWWEFPKEQGPRSGFVRGVVQSHQPGWTQAGSRAWVPGHEAPDAGALYSWFLTSFRVITAEVRKRVPARVLADAACCWRNVCTKLSSPASHVSSCRPTTLWVTFTTIGENDKVMRYTRVRTHTKFVKDGRQDMQSSNHCWEKNLDEKQL